MTNAIETFRLTKHYEGKRVVDSLDLRVPVGSVYGFLGRNGAGKSTTIKMLMGMVHPDSGRGELLGEDINQLSNETRARIAYLAEGHPMYGWMTVEDAVRFTRAFYPRWNHVLVDQILDHFELSRRQKFRRLSRGQQAQVSLALAVAPDPELLILDDPTLGLDTVVRRDFLESLIQIIQRQGRTILFSSHILGDVERVADRIGVMVGGVLRADCRTETFRESVRKIVLEFVGEIPDSPIVPGLVSSRQVGASLELVLIGYDDSQRQAVERLEPRTIEVLELNLEDAFIEYTRGQRRPLPVFATEIDDDQSVVLKELRESVGLFAIATLAAVWVVTELTGLHLLPWSQGGGAAFPFVNDGLGFYLWLVIGGLAIVLGLKQSVWESWHGTYYFLLHRPLGRNLVFGTKLGVGLALVLLVALVTVLTYAMWAASPGNHPTPFYWSMTIPAWQKCVSMTLVYLGAFFSGVRPARWFGTRLAPLAATLALVPFADAMPWWWLWLAIVILVAVVTIVSILRQVRKRDF